MAQDRFDADLNIIANSDIEFQVDPLNQDLVIIQKLADEPNDQDGLTAAQLKAKFDQAGLIIQDYINNTLIQQVNGTIATEAKRVANEKQRQANEAARQNAETDRAGSEAARRAAENDRVSAEIERAVADENRDIAEGHRVSEEERRVIAESRRQTAESDRERAENERETSENIRSNNEDTRCVNELTRLENETARQNAEETRQIEETERQRAERVRHSDEGDRLNAEYARQIAEEARVTAEIARENAQTAFFQGVSASAAMLPPGSDATASAAPDGGSFHVSFGIPAGGPAGKSAYQYAVDGGYTGTEAEFQALMADFANNWSSEDAIIHLSLDTSEPGSDDYRRADAFIRIITGAYGEKIAIIDQFAAWTTYPAMALNNVPLKAAVDLGDITSIKEACKAVNLLNNRTGQLKGTFGAQFVFDYDSRNHELTCIVGLGFGQTIDLDDENIVTT